MYKFDLQLFADEVEDDLVIPDEVEPDVVADEQEDDPATDEVDEEVDEETAPFVDNEKFEGVETGEVKFTQAQRAAINSIVAKRVSRLERVQNDKLQEAAGIDVSQEEVVNAMGLWGYLKANPEVSQLVDETIKAFASENEVIEPKQAKQQASLALKEAVLDLRTTDDTFNEYYQDVLDWAHEEGLDVKNTKSLSLAFRAWKADNLKFKQATKKVNTSVAKKKPASVEKEAPQVISGKRGVEKKAVDYSKMSAEEILKHEGLSLFTDD
jgi:hypothetical protein